MAASKSLVPAKNLSKESLVLPKNSLSLETEACHPPLSVPFSQLGVRFLDTPMPLGRLVGVIPATIVTILSTRGAIPAGVRVIFWAFGAVWAAARPEMGKRCVKTGWGLDIMARP
jgi:hypothetical protein